ncbi:hypothetical protein [Clostridium sp.]|uniref:hypothetical protein n=1 Tax=Clostridium sp. TaxID=1506 RepID=UPI003D6CAB0C
MKIETLQSLLISWLRYIKECQMVQTKCKPSSDWELQHNEVLEEIIKNSSNVFMTKHGYNLHKGNRSIEELLSKAELDIIGISFANNKNHIYAMDIAFNEAKLCYGTQEETIFRVIKKCIITVMCMYGYFGFANGTFILATPKIEPSVINHINACVRDIEAVLKKLGLNYKIQIINSENFMEEFVEPVISMLGDAADESNLFVEILSKYDLFTGKALKTENKADRTQRQDFWESDDIKRRNIDELKEMKIGVIVRTVLREMLENGDVSKEEIDLMQTRGYSKETFDIQYPLLQKASITSGISPKRYYSSLIKIYGESYFLCSEWYEVPANNDRPHLLKWFALHKD